MKQRYMAMCPRLTRGAAVCDRTAGKARASMRASGSQSRSVSCPTLRLLGLDWLVADRPRSRPARPHGSHHRVLAQAETDMPLCACARLPGLGVHIPDPTRRGVPRISPGNHLAERQFRSAVIARKLSHGCKKRSWRSFEGRAARTASRRSWSRKQASQPPSPFDSETNSRFPSSAGGLANRARARARKNATATPRAIARRRARNESRRAPSG
jgi:hypothetical protein